MGGRKWNTSTIFVYPCLHNINGVLAIKGVMDQASNPSSKQRDFTVDFINYVGAC